MLNCYTHFGQENYVTFCYKNCTAPLVSVEGREFRDLLSYYQLRRDVTYAVVCWAIVWLIIER